MRIEDLNPKQLAVLREAKADVLAEGFLRPDCTDQQFLNAVSVHRRTRGLVEMLGSAMHSPKFEAMNRAFDAFVKATANLWDHDGVWDADGWSSS